ncbi:hypothetical protein GPJ56_000087 [Histomonas meleagridis]|uniref:uncharacterized protein n=1 Tax=Histomonas meleagridis TaxID=135588 RepID=UPI00355A3E7C|nr:hypothetical protein GPJ56_000087 [Histomonas meleagridis]KAH0805586.1 hypothetical protein GO595_001641 [Histomonas meleagridis]
MASMSEMITQFNTQLRSINFVNDTNSISSISSSTNSYCPHTNNAPGIISSNADRDGFLKKEPTPSPTDYNVGTNFITRKAVPFNKQSSRPTYDTSLYHAYRDIGPSIDSTLPKSGRCIPFNKQSSRNLIPKSEDPIWKSLEEEQKRIIEHLRPENETNSKNNKRKKSTFELQTPQVLNPFQHIMRKEIEPKVPYNVEENKKSLDRPINSFDISQPSFKNDRTIYNVTEAPDIFYDYMEQFNNTIPSVKVPDLNKMQKRKSPYYYMPKTCGKGKLMKQKSKLNLKNTLDFKRMSERKFLMETPGAFKRNK